MARRELVGGPCPASLNLQRTTDYNKPHTIHRISGANAYRPICQEKLPRTFVGLFSLLSRIFVVLANNRHDIK